MLSEYALDFAQVHKSYGAIEALRDVTFAVDEGESVALLGANGAGKSTAISLLLGLRVPSAGEVRVAGGDPRRDAVRSRIGAMLQESSLPPGLKVSELLAFYRSLYPRPLPFGDVAEAARIEALLGRRVERLSGGQRRRVLFALALVGNPAILFLDEPTVGMDAESREQFWAQMEKLRRDGRTVLFTTHYFEEADRHAHRLLLLRRGRLIADAAPQEIRRLGGGRTIRFRTSEAWTKMLPQLLPDGRVEISGTSVQILTVDPERCVRRLLEQDVPLEDLEITSASLESALLQLQEEGAEE